MEDYPRTYQPIGPIVSALVFPRFASFSSSSMAFLMGKRRKFENQSYTKFGKSTDSMHTILGKEMTSEA
jgi:hypothetical protein